VAQFGGFQCRLPAAFFLIQLTHKPIHAMMVCMMAGDFPA
jgi:hypothetical protein